MTDSEQIPMFNTAGAENYIKLLETIEHLRKQLKYEANVAVSMRNEVFALRKRLFEYQLKFQEYERQKT